MLGGKDVHALNYGTVRLLSPVTFFLNPIHFTCETIVLQNVTILLTDFLVLLLQTLVQFCICKNVNCLFHLNGFYKCYAIAISKTTNRTNTLHNYNETNINKTTILVDGD